jgi:hypothetical protein
MSDENDYSWLEQFLVKNEEDKSKPADQRRLDELERMKKVANSGLFADKASNLNNIDKEKYLKLCEMFESEANFSCSAPDGWEAEYVRHMQAKFAKYGSGDPSHGIKSVGRKRLF